MSNKVQRTFTTPDGRKVTATVPEGATNDQIIKAYEAHRAAKASPQGDPATQPRKGVLGGVADFMGSFNRGLIGSWQDELEGLTSKLSGGSFDKGQADGAARHENYSREHPVLSTTGRGLGVASSLLLPEVRAMKGATMASRAVNGALTAGTYGAIEGAGQGDGLERARNALAGGATAATFGAAMAPAAAFAKGAWRAAAPVFAPAFGPGAIEAAGSAAAHRRISSAIDSSGLTPSQVADTVAERAAIGVPASPSDVSMPLRQLTSVAAKGIGPGQTMVQAAMIRKQENMAGRMRQHVDAALGSTVNPHEQTAALTEKARLAAKPLYDHAYQQPVTLDPHLQEFTQSPAGKAAMTVGATQIENTPSHLRNAGSENPTRPGVAWDPELGAYRSGNVPVLEAFDGAKRHLDDLEFQGNSPFMVKAPGMSSDTRSISLSRQALLGNLDLQVPAYGEARAAYAGPTLEKHAFEAGMETAPGSGRGTADDAASRMAGMSPSQIEQFRLGDRTRLANQLEGAKTSVGPYADASAPIIGNSGKRALVEAVHGKEAADKLYPRAEAEHESFLTYKKAFGGSNTSRDLADQADSPDPATIARTAALAAGGRPGIAAATILQRLGQTMTTDVGRAHEAELARVLTETDPAAVRAAMGHVSSRMSKDAEHDARITELLHQASKQFGLQVVGNSGDETGLYGPTN